ncbi:MAG: (Fe-S)-binding protein [Gammaproteobacteria bacterium]
MSGGAVLEAQEREHTNLSCIHCGLCLSVCPTYLQLGSEVDSPRGRIYLINAMQEGRISAASPTFEKHMQLCLECRACETACPSGVKFSVLMNEARATIQESRARSPWEAFLRRLVFKTLLPNRTLLRLNFRLLRFYQQSGLQGLARASGILRLLPKSLRRMEALLPKVPPLPKYKLPETVAGTNALRVSFFEGCIMPELFGPVHEATVRVLARNDVSVCRPSAQTCCGALHLHDGERELARELARRNIEAFERDGADFVVVNAAGCGAMLKEYGQLLAEDPVYRERAYAFSRRVKDISEYLDSIGLNKRLGRLNTKVAYDDPCHLLHGQGIKAAPRNLLARIPGLQLLNLPDADRCCGSAGIYSITHPEMAARITAEKIRCIAGTGAEIVATGNPGCLMQINQGLAAQGLRARALHPVELLDQSYQAYSANQTAAPPASP